ncbi:hypothetical protein GRI89_12845 [Altererythrobacter salegens]|uniref:Sulfotransferase n=1 Tax=Croceibacterium salegens TaxID=1737568 RepID=A0A6I4SWM4_9SPHN|nr:sulfotransferase [Croceibacterium salegens]MXO60425.1 hypothetical protein [Croceibacterium salegens]
MTTEQTAAAKADFIAALQRHDRAAVNEAAMRLISIRPPLGKTWKSIATALERNGEHDAALEALQVWRSQAGNLPEIVLEMAGLQARAGRHDAAKRTINDISQDSWNPAGRAYLDGTVATNSGERDKARESLRKAAMLDPQSGQTWIALAMIGKIEPADGDLIIAAERHFATREDIEGVAYYYALGRVHHQREAYAEAFKAFDEGARIMRGLEAYDPDVRREQSRASMAGWTRAAVEKHSLDMRGTQGRPLFVTGLPRSGTTLTEQILVSHSATGDGAELGLFRMVQQDVGGSSLHDLEAYIERGGSVAKLRETYNNLLAQRMPGDLPVIDKSLLASGYMGLLTVMFPERPVFWLRRDPQDNAWSDFSTFFLKGSEWSWSLEWIGDFFNQEDELHAFWSDLLPDRILTVPYAELVNDPEQWIRRIDEHAGLPFEEPQLSPHLSERVVSTASASQVRDPINKAGLNSSAPYSRWMEPFRQAYRGKLEPSAA